MSSNHKTSESDPILVNFLPQEELEQPGQLGLTLAPGKKTDEKDTLWERDLETDLKRLREEYGVGVLVSLMEHDEYSDLEIPELFQEAEDQGMEVFYLPIPDYGVPNAPEDDDYKPFIKDIAKRIEEGEIVVVHCRGGLGRSGLVASSVLVALGHSAEGAIKTVRGAREGAVETPDQEDRVRLFEMEFQAENKEG